MCCVCVCVCVCVCTTIVSYVSSGQNSGPKELHLLYIHTYLHTDTHFIPYSLHVIYANGKILFDTFLRDNDLEACACAINSLYFIGLFFLITLQIITYVL